MRKKYYSEVKLTKSHAVFPKLDRDKYLKYEEHVFDQNNVKKSRPMIQLTTLIHEMRTSNQKNDIEVSEITDRMRHSQQEYNEQVSFKNEYFDKTISHKNNLIADLELQVSRAKRELADLQRQRQSNQEDLDAKADINKDLQNQINSLKLKIQDIKRGTTKQKILEIKLQIEKLRSSLELKQQELLSRQQELQKLREDQTRLLAEKEKVGNQRDQLKNLDEDAQYLQNKIKQIQESNLFLKTQSEKLQSKISKKLNASSQRKDNAEELQRVIAMIDKFNKFERWCYELQDIQADINIHIDQLIAKLEQLENNMRLSRDKLMPILGILFKRGVGGVGFFIKHYLLEKKCAQSLLDARAMYDQKEKLKKTLKENLFKIKAKDIDTLKEPELVEAEQVNKIMVDDIDTLKAKYEEASRQYDTIFKDFEQIQNRLKQAYIQEIVEISKDFIFKLEGSHKTLDDTIQNVSQFKSELDQKIKKLRNSDKSTDLLVLEEKSQQIKDDSNKAKTALLVRETKFQEISCTDENKLKPNSIDKVFIQLQQVLSYQNEITDSVQDAYDVKQRSKDLHLLGKKVFKKTFKDLGGKMQTLIERRQIQLDGQMKKNQGIASLLEKIRIEMEAVKEQLNPEDEELNLVYDLEEAEKKGEETMRQLNSLMQWVLQQRAKIDFKDPDLKEVYQVFDDMEKMNPMVTQLNQSQFDQFNKATHLHTGIKDLELKVKNERINQFESAEKMTKNLLDKLKRSIERVSGRIQVIERQHMYLNDEFVDFEKKKESLSFKQEIEYRNKEIKARNLTKEKYRGMLEDIIKKFEGSIKDMDDKTPSLLLELREQLLKLQDQIKNEIDDLDGNISEDVSNLKEVVDSLNIKYSSKKKLLHQSIETQQELEQNIEDLRGKVEGNVHKASVIQKQLQALEDIENLEQKDRIQELMEQIEKAQEDNQNYSDSLDKQEAEIEEHVDPLGFCESLVVKTRDISQILAYLMSIRLEEPTQNIDDAIGNVKRIEKEAEALIAIIRNEKIVLAEQEQAKCVDVFQKLDSLLKETGQEVQDFKTEINKIAAKQPKLKNKDKLLDACDKFQGEIKDIVTQRNDLSENQNGINESFKLYDRKNGQIKDLGYIYAKLRMLIIQVSTKVTMVTAIQEEVRKLRAQFEADNWHESQRLMHLSKYHEFDDMITKILYQLRTALQANKEMLAKLEIVYKAMLQTQEYQPHSLAEKKLRRLQQLKEECEKIEELINQISESQKKIQDRNPDEIEDLAVLQEIVKEVEKLKVQAENEIASEQKITTSVQKKRTKLADAQLEEKVMSKLENLEKAKSMIETEIQTLISLEEQLEATKDGEVDPEEKQQVKTIITEFRAEIEAIKKQACQIELVLKQIQSDVKEKDLRNTTNLQEIADNILKLDQQSLLIQQLYIEIEKFQMNIKQKGGVIRIMAIEVELRQLRMKIEKYQTQFEDIKEQVDELSGVSQEYDGYTTEQEEDTLFKGVIKGGEEQLSTQDELGIHFNEVIQEQEQLLIKIAGKKKEQKGNFTVEDSEEFTSLLHSLLGRFQKYEDRYKKNVESLEKNQDDVCALSLEEKLDRRENEINEVEAACTEIETLAAEVQGELENEISENEYSDFYASYVKRLRGIQTTIQEILTATTEARAEKEGIWTDHQDAKSRLTRNRRPRIVLHRRHIDIKRRLFKWRQTVYGLRTRLKECQKDFKSVVKRKPVKKDKSGNKQLDENELIDRMLAELFKKYNVEVPTKRLGGGYYMFGIKKIYCKIINGKLVVRIGGGYMPIEEWIKTNAQVEKDRYDQFQAAQEKKGAKTTKAGKSSGTQKIANVPLANPETPQAQSSQRLEGPQSARGVEDQSEAQGKAPSRNQSTPYLMSGNTQMQTVSSANEDQLSQKEEIKQGDFKIASEFAQRRDSNASALSSRSKVSQSTKNVTEVSVKKSGQTTVTKTPAAAKSRNAAPAKSQTASTPANKISGLTAKKK